MSTKRQQNSRTIRDALGSTFKVMLTATPLQNSLLELFGMVSIIDEKVFGDLDSFRIKYGCLNDNLSFSELRQRIPAHMQAYFKERRRSLCPIHQTNCDGGRIHSFK